MPLLNYLTNTGLWVQAGVGVLAGMAVRLAWVAVRWMWRRGQLPDGESRDSLKRKERLVIGKIQQNVHASERPYSIPEFITEESLMGIPVTVNEHMPKDAPVYFFGMDKVLASTPPKPAVCPTCRIPNVDGYCRHCATQRYDPIEAWNGVVAKSLQREKDRMLPYHRNKYMEPDAPRQLHYLCRCGRSFAAPDFVSQPRCGSCGDIQYPKDSDR